MKIERWGNNIVIPLSQQEMAERGLNIGDDVDLKITDLETLAGEKRARRAAARATLVKMAHSLPPDWKFNRAELYEDGE